MTVSQWLAIPLLLVLSGLLTLGRADKFGDFTYTINDTSATITRYTGPGGNVTIPEAIGGVPVTGIGNYAFYECLSVSNITIPASVISLGDEVFYSCRSLTEIIVPNSVINFGSETFAHCYALTNVTLPNNITNIVDMMFVSCTNLAKITIPGSVTSIGRFAFGNCPKLAAITIPNSVTNLGDYAFSSCRSLTEVMIPDSVKNFGTCTFYNCLALTNVILPTNITNIMNSMFSGCSSLANIKLPETVTSVGNSAFYNCTNLTEITIPNSVTNIGAGAFRCSSLTSITIPDSVTSIGDNAFSGCAFLSSITIPAGVTNIGTLSFNFCANLTAITVDPTNAKYSSIDGVLFNKSQTILIKYPDAKDGDYAVPNGVTDIEKSAFYYCTKTTNITLPDGVLGIRERAFCGAVNLAYVNIPKSVTQISDFAFYGCANLTNIAIPASVISLGADALSHCSSMKAITVDAANTTYSSIDGVLFNKSQNTLLQCPGGKTGSYMIPSTVTLIRVTAFSGCAGLTNFLVSADSAYSVIDGALFNKDQNTLIICPEGRTGSFTIPDSVTKMEAYAFAGCAGLTNISIPNTIETISTNAFYNCTGLTNIVIPSSVHRLCDSAFMGCTGLSSIIIPSGVNWMEVLLFGECTNLTSVFFEGDAPKSDSSTFFTIFFNANQVTVYYRAGTKGWWTTFGDRPTALWVTSFPITDFTYTTNDLAATITGYTGPGGNVTIPDTIDGLPVKSIGDRAFTFSTNLANVTIPSSVTSIGDDAFALCDGLMTITVDNLNTAYASMDGVLFDKKKTILIQCPGGKTGSYSIPFTVTGIGYAAFEACSRLTSIAIPASVTNIDHRSFYYSTAFHGCSNLTNIAVDALNPVYASVDGVLLNKSQTALIQCPGGLMGTYVIPNGVTNIGFRAVSACANITNIVIPGSVTGIENEAFAGLTSLTNITIPKSVTRIGTYALVDCLNLKNVYFHGNAPPLPWDGIFGRTSKVIVYYHEGTTGWGSTYSGQPTAPWIAQPDFGDFTFTTNGSAITITGYTGPGGDLIIPETIHGLPVTSIGERAFAYSGNLISVNIPGAITQIGDDAFTGCTSLTTVYFQGNAPAIPTFGPFDDSGYIKVFYRSGTTGWGETYAGQPTELWIEHLTFGDYEYTITNSLVTITRYTGTGGIVSIPDMIEGKTVAGIGGWAFAAPCRLTSITIPDSVTSIGENAFWTLTSLTNVTLGNSVTNIGNGAFIQCFGLRSINIPPSVVGIGTNAFLQCTSLGSIEIPDGLASIGEGAFMVCTGLTNVVISRSVTRIGAYAFGGCTGLMAISVDTLNAAYTDIDGVLLTKDLTTLVQCPAGKSGTYAAPDSVTGLGSGAFFGCGGLTNITIPRSVIRIGSDTFGSCDNLTTITVDALNDSYASIDGVLFDKNLQTLIQYPGGKNGSYTVPNGVTDIGMAFSACTSLTSVAIPNGVTRIEERAFWSCRGLTNITLPNSVTHIGSSAFSHCVSLTNITLPEYVTEIGSGAFDSCIGLTRITIPNGVTTLGYILFGECTNLTSVTIPNSVTNLANMVFYGCNRLTSVYFGGNAPAIEGYIPFLEGPFHGAYNVTVFHRAGATGWTNTFAGQPTALWITDSEYADWAVSSGLLDQYPNASGRSDDADHDGMNNLAEMAAGTDPTDPNSKLAFESVARLNDLVEDDKTVPGSDQHALYFQSVPGRKYEIQSVSAIRGTWQTETNITNITATTTQKRVLVNKPVNQGFFRVAVVP